METPATYTTEDNPDQIEDASNDHAYFCMMPNMLDDLLDPYQYRLYAHIKRVCGEKGKCWQSTETIAKACKMSTGKVSQVKKELAQMGLLCIEEKDRPNGGLPYHQVTIVDIWNRNIVHCSDPHSHDERPSSPDEQASSSGETKKTPQKKTPEQDQESATPSPCDLTPTSFEGWLQAGQQSTNKPAVLKRMHDALFPDRESPAYSYIGQVSKRVGGPGRLAQLLWESAAKRPTGDVLAYIQAVTKGRKNGRHDNNSAASVEARAEYIYTEDNPNPLGIRMPTEEEREKDRKHIEEFYARMSTMQGNRPPVASPS